MARKFKKVDGGHGHHGGAWKVAYADFVTAMMALFMVLWLLASTDQKSRKEISNYFRTGIVQVVELPSDGSPQTTAVFIGATVAAPVAVPGKGDQSKGEVGQGDQGKSGVDKDDKSGARDEREKAAEDLVGRLDRLAALDPELAAVMQNVHVAVAPEGIVIEAVDEDRGLLFDVSSSRLNEPLERFLRALAPAISSLDRTIEINGHTDARPFATGARISNWDLSYQRAAAARDILEASGVASRLIVGVFARGSSQLYLPNEPYAPQNRRLSILVKIAKNGDTKLAASDKPVPN
ncbi:MAG TPA: flagellar motor protein MotB [Kofleriaceae bacterium]|nr:flagellar motor protein MotB [Kofleriaceae bacterium]